MPQRGPNYLEKFRSGGRFQWLRFLGSVAHLAAVFTMIIMASFYYPLSVNNPTNMPAYSAEALRIRQQLLEALDSYVRYQHYYREVYGRYSRDLNGLGVPAELSQGNLEEIRRYYEISVLEANPKRLLVLAHAQPNIPGGLALRGDRITIDEHYRINSNFPLPFLSKKYLAQEADRVMQLKLRKQSAEIGLAKEYWRFETKYESDREKCFAYGAKGPVAGIQRSFALGTLNEDGRGIASIFSQVKRHFGGRAKRKPAAAKEGAAAHEMTNVELNFLLADARLAEHIHMRERGTFASEWEALDSIASFRIVQRVTASPNLELEPIETGPNSFTLRVKGVQGSSVGELFTINETGEVKQIRFTDVLVKELKQSGGILQNSIGFQISELPKDEEGNPSNLDDSGAILEGKSPRNLKRSPSADLP